MTRISAVVPSYRRRDALLLALPNHLALDGVDEVVVVDDGSDDGTAEAVQALGDPRIRLVRHPVNRGLPAARNTGAQNAHGEWVLYLEDDCGFPSDYATTLLEVAEHTGADVVGAPWVHTEDNVEARTAQASPVDRIGLLSPPWSFPCRDLETPFMSALSLVRRSVFESVRYDEGYRGNFYREETDFYLAVRRAGFRVVLTPRTHSWQLGFFGGGCKPRVRLIGDAWAVRNTWRLLRKHGRWMRAEGLLAESIVVVEARVAWSRLLPHLHRARRAPLWALRRIKARW